MKYEMDSDYPAVGDDVGEMAKANMAPGQAFSAGMQGEMVVVGGCSGCCRLVERRPIDGPR